MNESFIVESKSIRDVLKECSYNSFVVFDLDNTVIESTLEIGSDQWVDKLILSAAEIVQDNAEAIRLVLNVYYAVQRVIQVKLVENDVAQVIKILQDIGIPVVALTSRGTCISRETRVQLADVNVHFDKQWKKSDFDLVIENNGNIPLFLEGIIFCNGNDKGKCFEAFLEKINSHPQDVVMVDDKKKYLNSVQAIVRKTGSHFEGIRYGYLDEKVAHIDMVKAQEELLIVRDRLPFVAQIAVQKLKILPSLLRNSLFSINNKKEVWAVGGQDVDHDVRVGPHK